MSATVSVLNLTGHKDEEICRYVAETITKETGAVTLCTGGFHVDGITTEQIEELRTVIREMTEEFLEIPV